MLDVFQRQLIHTLRCKKVTLITIICYFLQVFVVLFLKIHSWDLFNNEHKNLFKKIYNSESKKESAFKLEISIDWINLKLLLRTEDSNSFLTLHAFFSNFICCKQIVFCNTTHLKNNILFARNKIRQRFQLESFYTYACNRNVLYANEL